MKYIIVRIYEFGGNDRVVDHVAVVFPEQIPQLSHKDVARLHSASLRAVVSAGFCEIDWDTKTVSVNGISDTLKMASRSEDAPIIAKLFGW